MEVREGRMMRMSVSLMVEERVTLSVGGPQTVGDTWLVIRS